jgi:hypothetical protein
MLTLKQIMRLWCEKLSTRHHKHYNRTIRVTFIDENDKPIALADLAGRRIVAKIVKSCNKNEYSDHIYDEIV